MTSIISFISSQFENNTVQHITVLPSNVDQWKLVSFLGTKKYPFRVGLYADNNSCVVIKAWRGGKDSIHYHSLLREIRISKVLSKAQKKLRDNTVYVPSFIKAIDRNDGLFFVSEFADGKTLNKFSKKTQSTGYLLARSYLRRVSKVLTASELKTIGIRRSSYFIKTSIILFPLAIIKDMKHKNLFFNALSRYATTFSKSFKDKLRLVHGDLHPENIIKSGRNIYILDMEQAMVTFSTYEDATTVSTKKTPVNIEEAIMKKMRNKKKNTFRLMIIHVNIHNMVGILAKKNGQFYRERIKKALSYK